MKCQILLSRKNVANLSSAEYARSMVSVEEPSKIGSKQHSKNFYFLFSFFKENKS